MDKKIILVTKIVIGALIGIAFIFQILMIINSSIFQTPNPEAMASPVLGGYLNVAYIALGISVIIAILFPLIQIVSNPKQALKGLMWGGIIVVIGLISYLFASNSFTPQQLEKLKVTENVSVLVGAGLNLTLVIGIIAVLAAIFLAIRGSISK